MLELFKRMWLGWNAGIRKVFQAQTSIVMFVAFVLGLAPVALTLKLMNKKMVDRGPGSPDARSHWVPRKRKSLSMKDASRQF